MSGEIPNGSGDKVPVPEKTISEEMQNLGGTEARSNLTEEQFSGKVIELLEEKRNPTPEAEKPLSEDFEYATGSAKEEEQPKEAEVEKDFNYAAEVKIIEERYNMRMDAWEEVMKAAFKDRKHYEIWLNNDVKVEVEEGSLAERLIPMAKALKQKQSEIIEEKNAAMLVVDRKKDDALMKKIEAI